MLPFTKYLPHLSVTALIVFLAADYFSPNQRSVLSSSSPKNAKTLDEGSHSEGSHKENNQMEGSHNKDGKMSDLSQEEKERRMGIFHYNEGNKFYQEGNFSEAIIRYKKALHHNKGFKEAMINLSTTYLKNKMFDEALETLQVGQQKFPKVALIDYNLACYYSLTEKMEPGLSALQQAVTKGYKQFQQMESDPDLYNLRQSSEYKAWKKKMRLPTKT
jgi:tetratricopeptide (TPR) repeat protein